MDLGACGDKCSVCPRYLATVNKDRKLLGTILYLYVKIGHRPAGFDMELLKCRGCKTVSNCPYPGLKKCVESKKLDNCGQCDTYPCPEINKVFAKTDEYLKKLEGKCGAAEFRKFAEAFAGKKKDLDEVSRERSKGKNR
ncbi:MAG: DUF3795 domain-containing protein [bacterium]|nr:DUF3795 domain-containing protein [bacterium]